MRKLYFCALLVIVSIISCEKIPGLPGAGGGGARFFVSSISPGEGEPGSTVTIVGKGFGRDSTAAFVSFSGASAKVLRLTDTSMTVIVPESEAKIADIRVSIGKSLGPSGFPFHYLDVYTAGYVVNGDNYLSDKISRKMRVWKNGRKLDLFGNTSDFYTFHGILKDGNDLYLVANSDSNARGGYFKNSQFISIPNSHQLSGIVKRDNDIYVAGRYASDDDYKYYYFKVAGGFFKNGEFHLLGFNQLTPWGILFQGSDTILYGYGAQSRGFVTKNGNGLISGLGRAYYPYQCVVHNDSLYTVVTDDFGPSDHGYLYKNDHTIIDHYNGIFYKIYFDGDDPVILTGNGLLRVGHDPVLFPNLGKLRFSPKNLSGVNAQIYTIGLLTLPGTATGSPTTAAYFRNGKYVLLEKEDYVNSFAYLIWAAPR